MPAEGGSGGAGIDGGLGGGELEGGAGEGGPGGGLSLQMTPGSMDTGFEVTE